ncbi:type II secretion system protein GspK [Thalassotalea profundi]|uniref:T2SS protein K first SAM-like domain-containing protein n=1 Tax=Thalassotalea profundi TaxID=2036687 RepID=A0ABQ3IHI9_9GAMM|nr:type II secretion system protein GspK [Thalassotalea profundi]GHE80618.1 hypothetical protein GCM10011501_05710 [Thalassotalea profundi]
MNNLSRFNGAALIIVLLISIALASVSALLIVKTKAHTSRIKIAKNFLQAERNVISDLSRFIFEVHSTPYFIMGDSVVAPPFTSSLPKTANLFGRPFEFGDSVLQVQDGGGLLYLIPFNKVRITNYLSLQKWPADQIRNFLDGYADWVDKDDFTHLNGAESREYQVEGFPFNNKLQSKKELALLINVEQKLLQSLVNDENVILYNPGRDNYDYSPESLLSLNIQAHEVNKFSEARDNWLTTNAINPIENYSSLYWIINVTSSYGDAKSSRMFHLIRRFGDTRPFIVNNWQERVN